MMGASNLSRLGLQGEDERYGPKENQGGYGGCTDRLEARLA